MTVSRGADRNADGFFLRAESFYNVASNILPACLNGSGHVVRGIASRSVYLAVELRHTGVVCT